jgi:hypothetical protein
MRALIVGFGSIGRRHATNVRALQGDAELVLLRRDRQPDALAESLGALTVTRLDEALRSAPDLAVIATPSGLHTDTLLCLLEEGIPCYVEKPVVTEWRDLNRIREELAHRHAVPITLSGCNLRFLPSLRRLRSLLADGAIGNVVRVSLQAGQWLPDWRPSQDFRASYSAVAHLGGGVVLDFLHEIDSARWLLGEFDSVRALAGRHSRLAIETDDVAAILLGRAGGPVVSIGVDYVARRPMRCYDLVGDEGTLRWDLRARRLERLTARECTRFDCGTDGTDGFDVARTYLVAMGEFLDCVRRGRPTSQDIWEALRSTELALRAWEAAGR